MTIEHRLYRAANEVRELPVEIPDFAPAAAGGTTRRLLPTVVTSLLFLVGAFAVLADDAAPNKGARREEPEYDIALNTGWKGALA